jgi:hypothetical protein
MSIEDGVSSRKILLVVKFDFVASDRIKRSIIGCKRKKSEKG